MSEQNEAPTTRSGGETSGPMWLVILGLTISIAAVIGTAVVITEMSEDVSVFSDAVEPSTAAKWLAALTGLTATGVGLVVIALGLILLRIEQAYWRRST